MRKLMPTLALLAASVLTVSSCGDAGTNVNKAANNTNAATAPAAAVSDADVRKLLNDLQAALAKNDTAALEKIYAEDYTFVSAEGAVQTRAERLESMKSGQTKIESITFSDPKIKIFGDAAVVISTINVKGTTNGKDTSGTGVSSIVFAKTKDGLRVVHGHPSTTKPAAAAADNTNANANANKGAATAEKGLPTPAEGLPTPGKP